MNRRHIFLAALIIGCISLFIGVSRLKNDDARVVSESVFTLYGQDEGQWIEKGKHPFQVDYSTHAFQVDAREGEVRVRLSQKGGAFADLEMVSASACGESLVHKAAFYTDTLEDVLSDVQSDDNNVMIIHDKEIEVVWEIDEGCSEDVEVLVKANAYGHAQPFRYPETQTISYSMGTNEGELNIDGRIDEVDGVVEPDHSPLWEPVTGHPDSETHIYLSDNDEYFFVAMDVTMDNTDEYGEDWTEVVVYLEEEIKTFRVDDESPAYGQCGFGMTSKVSYRHQTCEFKIPKNNLNSEKIDFAIRYYGTGGGGGPGEWDLDLSDPNPISGLMGHSATVYNGKIYVFGGIEGNNFYHIDRVFIYDPSQPAGSRWSQDTTDPIPEDRSHGAAHAVGDKIYYLMGRISDGFTDVTDTVYIYDPDAADGTRWTSGTPAGAGNERHSFASAVDGTDIYVIGGMNNDPTHYDDVFKYDTVGDSWDTTTLTAMPSPRSRSTGQIFGGEIYVAGGNSTDLRIYNIGLDSWSSGPAFTGGYTPMAPCSAKYGDDFYVMSDYEEVGAYKYDTVGASWSQVENLNRIRMRCSAVELNGLLYTIGGYDDDVGEAWDDFETLTVIEAPLDPTPNYPDDGSTRAGVVILSAQYKHSGGLTGTTEYRVSTSSEADCENNINIETSAISAATATDDEPTFVNIGTLTNGTKYWCARNNDGGVQSNWTGMGQFEQDTGAPYINYGSFFGGSDAESITRMIKYYNGRIYVAGHTSSADFPVTLGAYDQTLNGVSAGFIAVFELNGAGTTDLISATFLEEIAGISDMAVDASGVYVVGQTNSGSFPIAGGTGGTPYDATWNNGLSTADSFISRFNLDLTTLEYSTYFGGTSFDTAIRVAIESGIVYVVGRNTVDFPTTPGAYDTSYSGTGFNMYIAAFDLSGNGTSDLLYSTYLGNDDVVTNGMDVNNGILYIGGWVDTSGQPITPGAFDNVKAGFGSEGYVVVFEPLGAELIYATYVGGSSQEAISDLIYDETTDTIIACGNKSSTDFYTTPGAYDSINNHVGFIFQLDPAGGGLSDMLYSTYLGAGSASCGGIVVQDGDVFFTIGANFSLSTTADAYANTDNNAAIMRMNFGGNGANDRIYASFLGGNENSLVADGLTMYMVSSSSDPLYPILADPGGTPYDSTFDPNVDATLLRIEFSGGAPEAPTLSLEAVGSGEVDLTLVPGADNGSAHTDFVWQYKEATSGVWITFPDGLSIDDFLTITGLTNGVLYEFRVAGVNASGQGNFSNVVQGTPLGTGRRRAEFPNGGAFFFFGSVPEGGGIQSLIDVKNFINRTSNTPYLYGAAPSGSTSNGSTGTPEGVHAGDGVEDYNPQGDPVQEQSTGAIDFQSFAIEDYLSSNIDPEKTDSLFLLDLVIGLEWLTDWRKQDMDYELTRPYKLKAEKMQKIFRTRWFHKVAGVDYLERIKKVDYNFDYRFPVNNETEVVVFMMRSILLTFGRSCFAPELLAYAEEVDVPGGNNPFWYYRYVQIMKPWMDVVLGEKGYQLTRSTDDIDALNAIFILLHQFCLGDGFKDQFITTEAL